ncbi:NAD(P)-dependent oxidoreductase [Halomonas piscis]|uniref:NAD(P)-dependent oxidoreductase n=1 Tax=Halomonas piscis TaxID=3031727 RepID=A0ABY9YYD1_9GAMM|nr:NAD(P)-dependent oxidoreductase [Halomonas piscis]WNK19777.1 NAD(P)-dependent oxidoreductase [Halomonas piscis]
MPTLITGNSGFVGLALTEKLLELGSDVVGFDTKPPSPEALRIFEKLPGTFTHNIGDIRDPLSIEATLASHPCDVLVTLAAVTADESRERQQPGFIYEVNVAGALHAIEAATRHGISRFIHMSSGSVYGKSGYEDAALDEFNTVCRPEGLYGMSKHAAEIAVTRLQELHEIDLVIGRLGTCFGPWEHDTGFRDTLSAPFQILKIAQNGQTAILPRDSKRDWLYIRDAASAITSLIQSRQLPHRIYNVASGFEFSLFSWCQKLQSYFPNFQWYVDDSDRRYNVNLYGDKDRASMEITKLLSTTKFKPLYDLDTAFEDFMSWQK